MPPPYGALANDADPVRPDGKPNVMPPNAPSTLNGHWGDPIGHEGIDVIGDVGLPVLAVAPGTVTDAHFSPMYGHSIYIDHGVRDDGYSVRTRYVHLDERLVQEGVEVLRGEQIGTLGRTGLLAGGIPHLHFEVQTKSPERFKIFETHNPHHFWADGAGIVTCFDADASYPGDSFFTTYPVPCRGIDWRREL